jgi:hypothetical protein
MPWSNSNMNFLNESLRLGKASTALANSDCWTDNSGLWTLVFQPLIWWQNWIKGFKRNICRKVFNGKRRKISFVETLLSRHQVRAPKLACSSRWKRKHACTSGVKIWYSMKFRQIPASFNNHRMDRLPSWKDLAYPSCSLIDLSAGGCGGWFPSLRNVSSHWKLNG